MTESLLSSGTGPRTILLASDLTARCDRALDRAVRLAAKWQAKLVILHVLPLGQEAPSDIPAIKRQLAAEMRDSDADFSLAIAHGVIADTIAQHADELKADLIITAVAKIDSLGDLVLGNEVNRLVRITDVPVLIVKDRAQYDYENLLVTSDFSNPSRVALEKSVGLFPAIPIEIVHAVHGAYGGILDGDATLAEDKAESRETGQRFVADIDLPEGSKAAIKLTFREGATNAAIYAAVEDNRTGLTVIGTHGRGGIRRAMLGSMAEELLACLPGDILMVSAAPRAEQSEPKPAGVRLYA